MTNFCTCNKQHRRLYADKCLNCDLPVEAMHNVNSRGLVRRTQGTCTVNLFGRRIDIVGNQAIVMGTDGQQDFAVEGVNAGDVMRQLQERSKTCGIAPVVSQDKLIRVAADELLGCLRRRRSAVGESHWVYYTGLIRDYNGRGLDPELFSPALKLLRCRGAVTINDSGSSVKLEEESDD